MTIGITINDWLNAGSEGKVEGQFTLDNSYPTGGYPMIANQFTFGTINRLLVAPFSPYIFQAVSGSYNTVNLKVLGVSGGAGGNATNQTTNSFVKALVTSSILTGTVKTPYASITLSQATSTATATVQDYSPILINGQPGFVVTVTSGTFDATHTVTGTNADSTTFTFVPELTLIDLWNLSTPAAGAILQVNSNNGTLLTQALNGPPITHQYAILSDTQIGTLDSDGWTSLSLYYIPVASGGSAGISEVSNGTDLSALSAVPFEAYGF